MANIINGRLIGERIPNLPKLRENKLPTPKNCDLCVRIHLHPEEVYVNIKDNHLLFHGTLEGKSCILCSLFSQDETVRCACKCHIPKPRIVYPVNHKLENYFQTHWTSNDIEAAHYLSTVFRNRRDDY